MFLPECNVNLPSVNRSSVIEKVTDFYAFTMEFGPRIFSLSYPDSFERLLGHDHTDPMDVVMHNSVFISIPTLMMKSANTHAFAQFFSSTHLIASAVFTIASRDAELFSFENVCG